MLHLPQESISKIKKYLIKQQKQLADQIRSLEKDDPVLEDGLAESPESGTESWAAEVHSRFVSVKNDLMDLSKRVTKSLINIRKGTYGKCEMCGKDIEIERIEAIPTATLCMSCSKKPKSTKTAKKK